MLCRCLSSANLLADFYSAVTSLLPSSLARSAPPQEQGWARVAAAAETSSSSSSPAMALMDAAQWEALGGRLSRLEELATDAPAAAQRLLAPSLEDLATAVSSIPSAAPAPATADEGGADEGPTAPQQEQQQQQLRAVLGATKLREALRSALSPVFEELAEWRVRRGFWLASEEEGRKE